MRRPSAVRTGMFCRLGSLEAEPPGDRDRLRVAGVHAPGLAIHHLRQLVGVGGFEFRHAAIVEQDFRQRVIERQFLQHFLVGGRIAARRLFLDRQLQFVEQDFPELLGRIQVERLPGSFVRTGLQCDQLFAQLAALDLQQVAVEQHAVAFHRVEHLHTRQFDVAVHIMQAVLSPVEGPLRTSICGASAWCSCSVMSASSAA